MHIQDVDLVTRIHLSDGLQYINSGNSSPALKEKNLHDEVNYIPIDDEGVFNRKHGKFEFHFEGVYIIEAIVDHNFFLPNHFRTSVKVLDEQKVLKEKEEKAYKGFLKEGSTTKEAFGE